MVGRFILYTRGAGALLRKGASGEGESGVPEEVPPQAPNQSRPISNGPVARRRPRQFETGSLAVSKGRSTKEDPAARTSGRKVPRSKKDLEEDAVSAWPAERILLLTKIQFPQQDLRAAQKFAHPWALPRI